MPSPWYYFGHENASSEIRLKTFFELFDNAAFYERVHVKSFIPDVSPPLASAIRQCAQIGSYSCTWTMHAASTVIGKPIKSVYPAVNGPADKKKTRANKYKNKKREQINKTIRIKN